MLVFLAAQGKKNCEIAKALDMSDSTVCLKLKDERIQFEIKHLRYKLYGKDHKKRFQEILPHAIDVTEGILLDKTAKPSTRFAAAQEVMDRALGKPKQTVEHEGSLFRALLERLDEKENQATPLAIEAEFTPLLPTVAINPNERAAVSKTGNPNLSSDPIDNWVSENL